MSRTKIVSIEFKLSWLYK